LRKWPLRGGLREPLLFWLFPLEASMPFNSERGAFAIYLVLTPKRYGYSQQSGPRSYSYLDALGRWAGCGTAAAPILCWQMSDMGGALDAAVFASRSRGRKVEVSSAGGDDYTFEFYDERYKSALVGPPPRDVVQTFNINADYHKLVDYSRVILAGASGASSHSDIVLLLINDAARRMGLVGVSWYSASQWLTGKRGIAAFQRVVSGDVRCSPAISLDDLMVASRVAHLLVGVEPASGA
jgi:hypothetical protein